MCLHNNIAKEQKYIHFVVVLTYLTAGLPMTSAVLSVRPSTFVTYFVPNTCTNRSKNLHSCFSPLKTCRKIFILEHSDHIWIITG